MLTKKKEKNAVVVSKEVIVSYWGWSAALLHGDLSGEDFLEYTLPDIFLCLHEFVHILLDISVPEQFSEVRTQQDFVSKLLDIEIFSSYGHASNGRSTGGIYTSKILLLTKFKQC